MSITVLSPHSGNQTQIRDKDIGRAVQDAEGRTFYVLRDENGDLYAALTKAGGQKDIERYRHMAGRAGFTTEFKTHDKPVDDYRRTVSRKPDGFPFGKLLTWLVVLGAIAAGAWYAGRKGYVKIPGITAETTAR